MNFFVPTQPVLPFCAGRLVAASGYKIAGVEHIASDSSNDKTPEKNDNKKAALGLQGGVGGQRRLTGRRQRRILRSEQVFGQNDPV